MEVINVSGNDSTRIYCEDILVHDHNSIAVILHKGILNHRIPFNCVEIPYTILNCVVKCSAASEVCYSSNAVRISTEPTSDYRSAVCLDCFCNAIVYRIDLKTINFNRSIGNNKLLFFLFPYLVFFIPGSVVFVNPRAIPQFYHIRITRFMNSVSRPVHQTIGLAVCGVLDICVSQVGIVVEVVKEIVKSGRSCVKCVLRFNAEEFLESTDDSIPQRLLLK